MIGFSRSVLGIDAAWTATQPSGVALVVEKREGWTLASVASSYGQFIGNKAQFEFEHTASGSIPNVSALLGACMQTQKATPDIVAVDMPLSLTPIVSRRVSDNQVSVVYGSRHCSTHTPSSTRPGLISDNLRRDFADAGYMLATSAPIERHALIEVYPHPALVELAGAAKRLPYKVSKIQNYWKGSSPLERRENMMAEWTKIIALLDDRILGVAQALPLPMIDSPRTTLKAFEDRLDAVVCSWVGICALSGWATPYGDSESAIWIPNPSARLMDKNFSIEGRVNG